MPSRNTRLLEVAKLFVRLSQISVLFFFLLCVFWFDHAVVLVAVFLHKFPLPPHQRGFFCSDNSIRLSYQSSTVSNTVLTAVGIGLPVLTVSPAAVRQEGAGQRVPGPARFFLQWLAADASEDAVVWTVCDSRGALARSASLAFRHCPSCHACLAETRRSDINVSF